MYFIPSHCAKNFTVTSDKPVPGLFRSEWGVAGTGCFGYQVGVLEAYTQTKRTDICFACELDDMFSDLNTARKAALLKVNAI